MSIYVITGKLGAGKSLLAVSRIREALRDGRRVATNLDLSLVPMLGAFWRRCSCVRVPDKPTGADLERIGMGADILDESRYGLLVLDELGSWLNSRQWGDKERQGLIEWLIHSRKRRWDVLLLVQNQSMMDKQVREALLEYLVTCKRLDKVPIPFFGPIGRFLTWGAWDGCIGRVHLGIVVYAAGSMVLQNALVVARWFYRGNSLFATYDTEQVFSSSYPHGVYSYLPPFMSHGRYMDRPWSWPERLLFVLAALGLGSRGGWSLGRVAASLRGRSKSVPYGKNGAGGSLSAKYGGRCGPQLLPLAGAVRRAFGGGGASYGFGNGEG